MVRLASFKHRKKLSRTEIDLIVVGLGNPRDQYGRTRHNAGVWVVDELLQRHGVSLGVRKRDQITTAQLHIADKRVLAAVPTTYMNNSGVAVAPLLKRYKIHDLSQLVVIHDELDLEVGRMKVKLGGGLAGHNGLKSICSHLHSADFTRLRIGINKPRPGTIKTIDYVLKAPSKGELKKLQLVVAKAVDAIEFLALNGPEATMNSFNQP